MTLDEAIKYAENMAFLSHKGSGNAECEQNHRQLAEWLRELKDYRARIPSYETGYNDAKREIALSGEYERAYKRGKSDAEQTRWIPVSEKLPKAGEYVGNVAKYYIVQNEHGDMLVARYTHSEYWEQIYQLKPIGDEIVAWMPLPEPYKAERSEEE